MSKDKKTLSLRLDKETHQRLKMQLLKEEKSFQAWAEEKVEEYLEKKKQEFIESGGVDREKMEEIFYKEFKDIFENPERKEERKELEELRMESIKELAEEENWDELREHVTKEQLEKIKQHVEEDQED